MANYLLLDINDIIIESDEFLVFVNGVCEGKWEKVHPEFIGKPINEKMVPFRRRINIVSKPCFNCGYNGNDFMYDRRCPACLEEGV